jgi:hypothetical protein
MIVLKRALAASCIVLATTLGALGANDDHPEAVAQSAAVAWLALLDAGDYAASWDAAATVFRQSISRADWGARAASLRGSTGALKSRTLRSETYTHTLPGAPPGDFVVIRFDASFAQQGSAIETVTPKKDTDGTWRVAGYYIK